MSILTIHPPTDIIDKLFTKNLKNIFYVFNKYGFEVRIVGGAIRDFLMKGAWRDIDIAVGCTPTEIEYISQYELNSINKVAIPGIAHGTVTVYFNPPDATETKVESEDELESYEITALDFSIKIKGNKLVQTQNADWETDMRRRDFTVNALSMDKDGKIYDYLGSYRDLKLQKIKFINDYRRVITEDPLLILRFFKILGKFERPKYDEEILDFIAKNKGILKEIKLDTRKWFMGNIQSQPFGDDAISLMKDIGIDTEEIVSEEAAFQEYFKKIELFA